jgi:hypothetical protein
MALIGALLAASLCVGCGDSAEAQHVSVPVKVSAVGVTQVTSDLGYVIDLDACRVAVRDLEFTTAGEAHGVETSSLLRSWLLPTAMAHPGHYAGGAIVGELNGRFIIDWKNASPASLGDATLLDGQGYTGLNLYFTTAKVEDGLAADDALISHTAEFVGRATSPSGQVIAFSALIDQDSGRHIVGAPFEAQVTASDPKSAQLQLLIHDPITDQTLFDGIDFAALDTDSDGKLTFDLDSEPYNRLRRAMQSHDFFFVQYQ